MILLAGATLAGANAEPAFAVTKLIINGSFEAGAVGTGGFTSWTRTNMPANPPATVSPYGSAADYPNGALGEAVPAPDVATVSPDAVGTQAAYFVGDFSKNERIRN